MDTVFQNGVKQKNDQFVCIVCYSLIGLSCFGSQFQFPVHAHISETLRSTLKTCTSAGAEDPEAVAAITEFKSNILGLLPGKWMEDIGITNVLICVDGATLTRDH